MTPHFGTVKAVSKRSDGWIIEAVVPAYAGEEAFEGIQAWPGAAFYQPQPNDDAMFIEDTDGVLWYVAPVAAVMAAFVYVDAANKKIVVGAQESTEPIALGAELKTALQALCDKVAAVCDTLSTTLDSVGGAISTQAAFATLKGQVDALKSSNFGDNLLSQVAFVAKEAE